MIEKKLFNVMDFGATANGICLGTGRSRCVCCSRWR